MKSENTNSQVSLAWLTTFYFYNLLNLKHFREETENSVAREGIEQILEFLKMRVNQRKNACGSIRKSGSVIDNKSINLSIESVNRGNVVQFWRDDLRTAKQAPGWNIWSIPTLTNGSFLEDLSLRIPI